MTSAKEKITSYIYNGFNVIQVILEFSWHAPRHVLYGGSLRNIPTGSVTYVMVIFL